MKRLLAATAALLLTVSAHAAEVPISRNGYTGTAQVNADGTGTFKVGQTANPNRPTKVKGKFSGAEPTSKTISFSFFGTYTGKNAAVRGRSATANPNYTPPKPPEPPTPPTPPGKGCEGGKSYSQHGDKGHGGKGGKGHSKRS